MSRSTPKIVLAYWDGLGFIDDNGLHRIGAVGELLDRVPLQSWDDDRADDLLGAAEVIVGHWGCPPVDGEVLRRAPKLGLFAYAAGTVKGTVGEAIWDRDIRVTSGANANAEPVAEFTLATILLANKGALWRRTTAADPEDQYQPVGDRPWGNYDKTIGIVGASLIGRRVIELLRPFPNLRVALYDPFVDAAEAAELDVVPMALDELCASADLLSIHAPELPSTRHMIGSGQLTALRDGAIVINTARGSLVDHDALIAEVRTGRLYAVLDVTEPEPLAEESPLRSLPNVYLTPHLAGTQGTELGRMVDYVVDEIERWSGGRPARNEVTRDQLDRLA